MKTIEIEKRFLVKEIPNLSGCKKVEMIDVYIPEVTPHAKLRARKIGEKYELTKKTRKQDGDHYTMVEQTIDITPEEFAFIYAKSTRRIEKDRYYVPLGPHTMDLDVFKGKHQGLIIGEIEFPNEQTLQAFAKPPYLGKEINTIESLAGGVLSGLTYEELKPHLERE